MTEERADYSAEIQGHIDEFRANDGRLGGYLEGADMLLLHSTGAKSGAEHICPLTYQSVGGGYAVFASNYGGPDDPAWVANLRAHPETTTEIGTETVSVKARITEGSERDAIWARQVEIMPGMGEYTKMTDRVFPIIVLERR